MNTSFHEGTSGADDDNRPILEVDFIDEAYFVEAEGISFGRQGDIVIDEANTYMHRQAGDFVLSEDTWWFRNQSTHTEMVIKAGNGRRTAVPPGATHQLSEGKGTVAFQFGLSNYEIDYRVSGAAAPPVVDAPAPKSGTTTHTFGVIRINEEQRLMLTALCETRLRQPDKRNPAIAANATIAHRLGWTLRKFDRKLDYVCRKLSETGVPGLRGEKGHEASDRREHLVEHMLRTRAITEDDLAALDAVDAASE